MSVQYILSQIGAKIGQNPDDADQRKVLLRFLNEAARELYDQSDMAGSLWEQCFKVNGDQTLALPSYIGDVRAVREFNSMIPWNINQMRPRYNVSNWPDMWRNFRLKNKQALTRAITNAGPVTITCNAVETVPVTIVVAGSTLHAQRIVEEVVMDVVSKTTTNNFTDIVTLLKSDVTTSNYQILDMDGNEISMIPNDAIEATYQVIDVSQLPWLNENVSPQDHFVEILYKLYLPQLIHDGDEFPAQGYDNVIVNKGLQLWCEEKGDSEGALMYDTKATRTLARIHENQNRATQDRVALTPNPHDSLLQKVRTEDRWRLRGWSYLNGTR